MTDSPLRPEAWLPIVDYEGLYEVSDRGVVRSLDRWVPYGTNGALRFHRGKIIAPFLTPPGDYLSVSLGKGGKKLNHRIHVLVLKAFVGPRPTPKHDGCHGLGGKLDNQLSNLRWDTKKANMQDFMQTGGHHNGSKTRCKRDHEFTPENTYVKRDGGRQCKQCVKDAVRAKRLAAAA